MAKKARGKHRCLIVERHPWETGGSEQQLQFPLKHAASFFGTGRSDRTITLRVFVNPAHTEPSFSRSIVISREYANGTRRTNRFPEMGGIPSSFVFFEETSVANTFDFWWIEDKAGVMVRYGNWVKAKDSQYGRGRLSNIVASPATRVV